jgi:hypothetical protein
MLNALSVDRILAVVGLVFGFYFYVRSKREKKPAYLIQSFPVIEQSLNKIGPLKITYADHPIKTLTLANITLFNLGADVIMQGDVAGSDNVRVVAKEGVKILSATIVREANPVNRFKVQLTAEGDRAPIEFEYMGRMEGVTLAIYHTGTKMSDLQILGSVKGVGPFQKYAFGEYQIGRVGRAIGSFIHRRVPKQGPFKFLFSPVSTALTFLSLPILLAAGVVDAITSMFVRQPKWMLDSTSGEKARVRS